MNKEQGVSDPRVIALTFENKELVEHVDSPIQQDLSAAARYGDALFLSCDETAGIDRLMPLDDGGYGRHVHFNLGDLIALPDGPDGEMDIEGLDVDGDWLWVVGSHSLKRAKPSAHDDPEQGLRAMEVIKRDPNRSFLARLPLQVDDDGPRPVARDGERRLTHLKLHPRTSELKSWLEGDAHLAAFLDLPSKENGLDIEGIVARGLRVWLGLRGPVLHDMAVILEFQFKVTGSGHLKARRIDGRRRYRKHLIASRGLGVRDLAFDGDDMLILTGPTTVGDGAAEILRWRSAMASTRSAIVPAADLSWVRCLPYRGIYDHPEGLVKLQAPGEWLVVYDSPAPDRTTHDPARVTADIWQLDP